MIDFAYVDRYLKDKGATSSRPFSNDLRAYEINGDVFAYVGEESKPLRISLKVDEVLIKYLTEKYESVMPGHKLDPTEWLTLIVVDQLTDQEIIDLIYRSINLAKGL